MSPRLLGLAGLLALALASPPAAAQQATEFDVVLLAAGANKIAVIKAVRELTGLGLKEAKDLVEAAPKVVRQAVTKDEGEACVQRLVEAGATVELRPTNPPPPPPAPPPPAPPPSPADATRFDVVLLGAGATKIQVIKAVRELTGLGLKEAKDLVEAAPKVVRAALVRADAEAFQKKLVDAGATVELRSSGPASPPGAPPPPPPGEATTLDVVLVGGGAKKARVIRVVMAITGQRFKAAKAIVEAAPRAVREGLARVDAEALRDRLVEAGATVELRPTASPAPPPGPPPAEATTFDVVLLGAGTTKLQVIKAVRELTGLGLKEAKDLVEAAPKVVRQALVRADAEAFHRKLTEAGATVELRPSGDKR